MEYLKQRFDDMKVKLTNLLREKEYICVTCDVWSSRAEAFLGMTVHFIDSKYKLNSFVLAFRPLKKRQTHQVMAEEISKVLSEFGIDVEKITHIVTDGGSAFGKTFKVYGKGSDALVEKQLNPIVGVQVSNENENEDEMIDEQFIRYDDGEVFFSNVIQFDQEAENGLPLGFDDDSNSESNSDIEQQSENEENYDDLFDDIIPNEPEEISTIRLPKQRRCLSHLLNLLATDFEKELSGRAKIAYVKTFSKLQALWVVPRKSPLAKTICKETLGCTLKMPC